MADKRNFNDDIRAVGDLPRRRGHTECAYYLSLRRHAVRRGHEAGKPRGHILVDVVVPGALAHPRAIDGQSLALGAIDADRPGSGHRKQRQFIVPPLGLRLAAFGQLHELLPDDHRQLFLNFTADSVSEGVHTLAPTIAEIDSAEILRDRVIFEVIEAERTPDLRQLRTVVDCVRGAGFRVQRPERNRTWGHPSLVAFVRELGARVKKLRLPLIAVGDLGQPRGGPAPSGHASHQSGLDADVAFPKLRAHLENREIAVASESV